MQAAACQTLLPHFAALGGCCAEDRLLFLLTRQVVPDSHRTAALEVARQGLDWRLLFDTASAHRVAPLVWHNLSVCGAGALDIPRDVAAAFARCSLNNKVRKEGAQRQLERTLAFFNKRGLDVMILKGTAMDLLVYDRPWYTMVGDADLVVRRQKGDLPREEFLEIWNFLGELSGVEFDFYQHHDITMSRVLPVRFDEIWRRARHIRLASCTAWVPSDEDLLLCACITSCRKRFFRLKNLCDIAEITVRLGATLDWSGLAATARQYRCEKIVYAALTAVKLTLGGAISDRQLSALEPGRLPRAVIRALATRMSYSSLAALYAGPQFRGRAITRSLVLPYACYPVSDWWRQARLAIEWPLRPRSR